jgi:hypothetical protein
MSATVNEIKQLIGDQGQSNILKNIIMSTNDLKEAAHKGLNMFRQLNNKY